MSDNLSQKTVYQRMISRLTILQQQQYRRSEADCREGEERGGDERYPRLLPRNRYSTVQYSKVHCSVV
jgi:hypothetical protein